MQKTKIIVFKKFSIAILTIFTSFTMFTGASFAGTTCGGSSNNSYSTSIDFGCSGKGNPILDLMFGIIRFLTYGVGIIISGSIIVGGIQYISSQGNPENTNHAVNRIRNALIALLVYIFAYPLLNYLLPTAVLK